MELVNEVWNGAGEGLTPTSLYPPQGFIFGKDINIMQKGFRDAYLDSNTPGTEDIDHDL